MDELSAVRGQPDLDKTPTSAAAAIAESEHLQGAAGQGHPRAEESRAMKPSELKYYLTTLLYPAILLIFVALYVTSLAAGIEPEVGLLRAGGACVVLAILARVAVSILGDENRLVLNDREIVAMAQSSAIRSYLANAALQHPESDPDEPAKTAQSAGPGGKD